MLERALVQIVLIVSGCDYVSFFSGLGKAAFMNAFYQYSTFITGGQEDGYLSDNSRKREDREGLHAFIRLIGTLYFKKHLSAFVVLRNVQTPIQLFNSTSGKTGTKSGTKYHISSKNSALLIIRHPLPND